MHDPSVPPHHVNFGPFELSVRSGELRKGATRLRVPDQSIEILKALVEHPGELVTREQLRERLWPANTFVDFEHGLNAAVRRLRDALGDSADSPRYIETLPRRGYRFIGSVEGVPTLVAAPQAPVPIELSSAGRRVEPPARKVVTVGRLTARRVALIVLIVSMLGIALYFIRRGSDRPTYDYSAALKSIPVTSLPGSEVDPSLSPDGKRVAFAWDGETGDNFDIYMKQLDAGARPVQLTTDAAEDRAPAWSPDGLSIAFVRRYGDNAEAFVLPRGGPERPLTGITGLSSGLSWTPDGKALVFVGRDEASTRAAVFSYSLETGERRRLVHPTPAATPDTPAINLTGAPVISPDGKYLAFIGIRWRIFVQQLDALRRPVGEPKPFTNHGKVFSLTWAHDSGSIIYTYWGEVPRGLWRVPIAGGQPLPVYPNVPASMPSVASNGTHLIYQNTTTDKNIWRMPGPLQRHQAESETAPEKFIASTEFDMSPQISPDRRSVVFVSTRSGHYELWLSNIDSPATTAQQLTKFEGAFLGSPRWSANGDFVAFDSDRSGDSNQSGPGNIWVVGVDGIGERQITNDSLDNNRPSWSRDGRWIYFSSGRSDDLQIRKVLASGGTPLQLPKTRGAREAFESPDGKHLYYAKPATPGIWRVPLDGGDEVQVIDEGMPGWWAVIDGGIVLMNKRARPQATVKYFSFDAGRITWTRQLPPGVRFDANPGFSVSLDGQWMLFVQLDHWGSDIHMLQNSR